MWPHKLEACALVLIVRFQILSAHKIAPSMNAIVFGKIDYWEKCPNSF